MHVFHEPFAQKATLKSFMEVFFVGRFINPTYAHLGV